MQRARGFTLLEVVAGLGLAMVPAGVGAVQLVALVQTARAAGAGLATASLRLARDTGTALALATERLEALRVGPRADGADSQVAPDGTRFQRSWTRVGGRGTPERLSVRIAWGRHALELATEALP